MTRNDIASIPLLPITVCFSFGIILYVYGLGLVSGVILLLAAIFLAFINSYYSTLALAGVLGLCQAYINIPLESDVGMAGKQYVLHGTIDEITVSDAVQSLVVSIDSAGSAPNNLSPIKKTKLSVIYPDFIPEFKAGEKLVFGTLLEKITATYDLPDEIDPAEFLIKKGIFLRAYVTSENIYSLQESTGFAGFISQCRAGIFSIINESDLSDDSKELLIVMLTGDSSELNERTREMFTIAGISHILAISGLHVGIIAFLVSIALWPLYISGHGNLRWLLVCLAVWFFAIFTGMSPSVIRAAIMTTVYLFARILRRNSSSLNSLCLAAIIILLFNPDALFQTGFQLSFAAVASILLFARSLNPVSPRKQFAYNLMSYIAVSVSAMLGTSIISAFHFHSFPVYFLITNVIATLILPFFLSAGIIFIFTGAIGFSIPGIDSFIDLISGIITGSSSFINGLPGSSIDGLYFPAWLIIPYIGFIFFLKLFLDKPDMRRLLPTFSLLLIVITTIAFIPKTGIESRIYLSRNLRHTELIYSDRPPELTLITNTPNAPVNVSERALFRYRDFMARRGINAIRIDTSSPHSDRMIYVDNKKIALISGKKETFSRQKINYVIIAKGFRDKIEDICQSYTPDTIIIASDIHPRRAQRYKNECRLLGQPFTWARERPWSFGYSNSLKPIVK